MTNQFQLFAYTLLMAVNAYYLGINPRPFGKILNGVAVVGCLIAIYGTSLKL